MARLYCPKEFIHGKEILINDHKQIHYLCDVLRLKVNDDVFVFDGDAHEYHCEIQGLSKKAIRLLIKEEIKNKFQVKTYLAIACALPKQKSRFDDLVDKLSQLGVNKIIPMITKRVIVRWDSNLRLRHHQRWRKIAESACIQSGRNILTDIEPVKEINQILTPLEKTTDKIGGRNRENSLTGLTHIEPYDLKLIPTLVEKKHPPSLSKLYNEGKLRRIVHRSFSEGGQNLRGILSDSLPKSILVLIGPEGDFTSQELTQAKNSGFIPVLLGDLVLRVDTAAIAVAAFIRLNEYS